MSPPPVAVSHDPTPVKLDISRRNLKNFLTEEEVLAPYLSPDGTIRELRGVFMIGSESSPFAFFWDSLSCRLLGVIDITRPVEIDTLPPVSTEAGAPTSSPYVLTASGPPPFAGPAGKPAPPVYFGFRLIEGKPEFLYTSGPFSIEERIWLEDGGEVLKQRFSVRNSEQGFRIQLPLEWKKRVEVSAGTWKNETLTVPSESANELTLTYRLGALEPEPVDSN